MRSPVTDQPNSRTMAGSRSSCPSTTATMPFLPPTANDLFNSLLECSGHEQRLPGPQDGAYRPIPQASLLYFSGRSCHAAYGGR